MIECADNFNRIVGDGTYGEVKVTRREIALAEDGWRIKEVLGPLTFPFQNIDMKTDVDQLVHGGHPVHTYRVTGDLNGPDIGQSKVQIIFANLNVTLEKIGDCISQ